jgi:DHA1 family inner membrane transport protein
LGKGEKRILTAPSDSKELIEERVEAIGRIVFPTLILSVSSMELSGIVINTGLLDIALMFGVSISLAGQMKTVSSLIGIIAALGMGILSVKFDHKIILITGMLINFLSALGCSVAPSFGLLFLTFSATGLVGAMVSPMIDVYIGKYYVDDERPRAIGTLVAFRLLSYLLSVQIISFIIGRWSFRHSFIIFIAPYILLSMILAMKILPRHRSQNPDTVRLAYLDGYRVVFSSRSAVACLIGTLLATASWRGMVTYLVSYIRDRFLLPLGQASMIFSVLVLGLFIGSYLGGRLVHRFGRKPLAVVNLLFIGLLIMGLMNMPDLTTTLILVSVLSLIGGVRLTASNSLTIEQVPSVRGTMMSMNIAAVSLGSAIGSGLGGLILHLHGWWLVSVSLGVLSILAMCVYQLLVIDPTRTGVSQME